MAEEWANFSTQHVAAANPAWMMTDEQITYYSVQFSRLQPNPRGLIPGALARDFFSRSGLSNSILSHIWKLSDLNADGHLSIDEFCIAMHLVVAVRHKVALPDNLPSTLHPITSGTLQFPGSNLPLTHDKLMHNCGDVRAPLDVPNSKPSNSVFDDNFNPRSDEEATFEADFSQLHNSQSNAVEPEPTLQSLTAANLELINELKRLTVEKCKLQAHLEQMKEAVES